VCENGKPLCPHPRIVCDGVCVDPRTDSTNCGGCSLVCPLGSCADGNLCTMTIKETTSGRSCGAVCIENGMGCLTAEATYKLATNSQDFQLQCPEVAYDSKKITGSTYYYFSSLTCTCFTYPK
jgi:hypothetical protein